LPGVAGGRYRNEHYEIAPIPHSAGPQNGVIPMLASCFCRTEGELPVTTA